MSNVDSTQQPKTLEEALGEIESLRSQLSGSDLKVFSQNRELRVENQKLKDEIRQLTEQCVTQTFKVRGLEKSEDKLRKTLDESQARVVELESEVGGLEGKIGELQSKVEQLESKVTELGGELDSYRSKETQLSKELENTVRSNSEAVEKLLAEHSQEVEQKSAEFQAVIADREKAIEQLEQRVEQFKEEFLSQELTLDTSTTGIANSEQTGAYELLSRKMEEFLGYPGRALVEQVFRLSGVEANSVDPSELEETFEVLQDTASQLVQNDEQEQELTALLKSAWQELRLGDADGAAKAATNGTSKTSDEENEPEPTVEEPSVSESSEAVPQEKSDEPAPESAEPEKESAESSEQTEAPVSESEEPAEEQQPKDTTAIAPAATPQGEEAKADEAAEPAKEESSEPSAEPKSEESEESEEPSAESKSTESEEPSTESKSAESSAESKSEESEEPSTESKSAESSADSKTGESSEPASVEESEPEEKAEEPDEISEPEVDESAEAETEKSEEKAEEHPGEEPTPEGGKSTEPQTEEDRAESSDEEPEVATEDELEAGDDKSDEADAEEVAPEAVEVLADFDKAATYLEEGNHAEALPIFELLQQDDPTEPTHQVGRLACLAGLSRFKEAFDLAKTLEGSDLGESQEVFLESMETAILGLANEAESELVKKEYLLELLLRARPDDQIGLYLDEADEIPLRVSREGELSLLQAKHRVNQDDVTEYLIDVLHSLHDRPTVFALLKTNLERYPELQPLSEFMQSLLDSPRAEALEAESNVRDLLGQGESVEDLLDEADPGEEAVVQVFLEHMLPRSGVECDIPSEDFEELMLDAEPAAFVGSLRQALRSVDYTVFFEEIEVLSYDGDEHFLLRSSPEPKPTLLFGEDLDDVPPEELRFLVLRELFSMYRRHSQLKHISAGLDDQKRVELIRACIDIFSEFESKVPEDTYKDLESLKNEAQAEGQDEEFRARLESFLREVYLATESDSFLELGDFLYNEQLNRKWLDPIADNFGAKQTGMVVASYAICRDILAQEEFEELEEGGFGWLYSEENRGKHADLRLRLQRLWSSPLKALISEPEE